MSRRVPTGACGRQPAFEGLLLLFIQHVSLGCLSLGNGMGLLFTPQAKVATHIHVALDVYPIL